MGPQSSSSKKTEAFDHEYTGVLLREGAISTNGIVINTFNPLVQSLEEKIQHAHQDFGVNMLLQPNLLESG